MWCRNAAMPDRVIFHRSLAAVLVTGAILPSATLAAASAPNTTIKSGPAAHTTSRSAAFGFVASAGGASFQCKLDRAGWSQCSSPKRFSQLKEGRHVFRVRARKNRAMDPSPATRIFTVDHKRHVARWCAGYCELWAGDVRRKLFAALQAYDDLVGDQRQTRKVRLLAVTAPGVAAGLVWDEAKCAHLGEHRHDGRLGCRVADAPARILQ
jgi:hypothetical protein